MATSSVAVTEGAGKNLATHSITEDAATKEISRVHINDSAGADVLGTKADAKSTATDTTAVSAISIWKQISASIQALVTAFGSAWTRGAGAADANTQRVTIDSGQMGSLGQAAMEASVPVAIASNQSAVPVAHNTTGIGHGVTTVTTAGTDVALASSTAAKWVTVQAQTDNTGVIAVGATGVDATVATGTGVALAAGESITLLVDNLADIFIDSTVNGEGVRYTYGT